MSIYVTSFPIQHLRCPPFFEQKVTKHTQPGGDLIRSTVPFWDLLHIPYQYAHSHVWIISSNGKKSREKPPTILAALLRTPLVSYIDKNVGLCERTKGFSNLPQEGQDAPVAWTKSEGVTGERKDSRVSTWVGIRVYWKVSSGVWLLIFTIYLATFRVHLGDTSVGYPWECFQRGLNEEGRPI